jgi:hypothetical protein
MEMELFTLTTSWAALRELFSVRITLIWVSSSAFAVLTTTVCAWMACVVAEESISASSASFAASYAARFVMRDANAAVRWAVYA